MESREFGARIRELRTKAGLSQRELADKIGVNFTYLSKIESGAMPPPSEKVIVKLAEVLNADKDELIMLAGRIPSDIAQILKNREVLQSLRKAHAPKKERTGITTNLVKFRTFSRVAIAFMLVAAIATSLWFAAPTKALEINFTTQPSDGNLGSKRSFEVEIKLTDPDQILPIDSIDLYIYKVGARSTYQATCTNLPLADNVSKTYLNSVTGGGKVVVTATGSDWLYGYGYSYAEWEGQGYTFGGYKYGYGYGSGTRSITYDVEWTSPSGWPEGSYRVEVKLTANGTVFPQTSDPFTLSERAAPPSGGGGGGGGAEPEPGVTVVTDYVTSQGRFRQEVTAESADGKVVLVIPKDTIGLTKTGLRLKKITITIVDDPPQPPEGTIAIGSTYNFDPDGTTFTPPVNLTIYYDATEIIAGYSEEDMAIVKWDEVAGEWVELEGCIVDTVRHAISVPLSGFSQLTIIAYPRPAAFTTGQLSISPSVVNVGEIVNISAVVTNTGLLEGSYSVTLKIDDAIVATRSVTLTGGASETVSFSTTKDTEGIYSVNVNGLTGSFTVRKPEEPPPPPSPAAFTITSLTIYPTEVEIGESVTIRVAISNTGDLSGTYDVTLKVDDVVIATRNVTVNGGASKTITFTTSKDAAGKYTIDVNGQKGTFDVSPAPERARPINWWLIGGIIAGVVAVSVVAWLIIMHRRLEERPI